MDSVIEGFKVNTSLCASVIALLMAMIGISLPLIINSTSKALSEYQNQYIHRCLKKRKIINILRMSYHGIRIILVVFFLTDIINLRNEWVAFVFFNFHCVITSSRLYLPVYQVFEAIYGICH